MRVERKNYRQGRWNYTPLESSIISKSNIGEALRIQKHSEHLSLIILHSSVSTEIYNTVKTIIHCTVTI